MSSSDSTTNRLVIKSLVFVLLAISSLLLLRPLITGQSKEHSPPRQLSPAGTKSASLPDSDPGGRINALIDESESTGGRWGVCVISMADGSVIFERNGNKLFTPASNMKIYTTGVALDLLGANYRWRTSVYAEAQPDAGGTVAGDLILYGRGAPDLIARGKDEDRGSLAKLADDLYARGVRSVKGNVVGDEVTFAVIRSEMVGSGRIFNGISVPRRAPSQSMGMRSTLISFRLARPGKPQPCEPVIPKTM